MEKKNETVTLLPYRQAQEQFGVSLTTYKAVAYSLSKFAKGIEYLKDK